MFQARILRHFASALLASSLFLAGCASTGGGGVEDLPVALGSDGGCRLSASDSPSKGAKGQTLRLAAVSFSETKHTDLRTGRSHTLASLMQKLDAAFAKAGQTPSGGVIDKLGDLAQGGEARFVSDGKGGVEVVYAGGSSASVPFSADEVASLRRLLQSGRNL